MNFPVFNPVKSGMETGQQMYQTINQGIAQQLQNQMMREKMPYVGQQEAASLQKTQAEIARERAMAGLAGIQYRGAEAKLPVDLAALQMELQRLEQFKNLGLYDPKSQEAYSRVAAMSAIMPQLDAMERGEVGFGAPVSMPEPARAIASDMTQYSDMPGSIEYLGGQQFMDSMGLSKEAQNVARESGKEPNTGIKDRNSVLASKFPVGLGAENWGEYLPPAVSNSQKLMKNMFEGFQYDMASEPAKQAMVEQSKMQSKQKTEDLNNYKQLANDAVQDLQELNKMKDLWKKIPPTSKGLPYLDMVKLSPEAQEFDKSLSRLVERSMKRAGGAGLSNLQMESLMAALPRRTLKDKSFNNIADFMMKNLNRDIERYDFYRNSYERGADKDASDSSWLNYTIENPLYMTDQDLVERRQQLIQQLNQQNSNREMTLQFGGGY